MNDFTKEELQIINIELNINFNRSKARKFEVPEIMTDLIRKIRSMIDNYCDHDWQNRCCGVYDAEVLCGKCGRKL